MGRWERRTRRWQILWYKRLYRRPWEAPLALEYSGTLLFPVCPWFVAHICTHPQSLCQFNTPYWKIVSHCVASCSLQNMSVSELSQVAQDSNHAGEIPEAVLWIVMILCVSGNNLTRRTSSENSIHDGGEKRFNFIPRKKWHRHPGGEIPTGTRTYSASAVHITHFGALEHDNAHHRIETRIPAGSNIPERAISVVLIHGGGGKFG